MQWQGKSPNFSTNQVRWISHFNISWNSGNWIYELHQDPIRTYSKRYNSRKSKLKTEIKKLIEEKYKKIIEKLTTEMNDKEKCLVDISTVTGVPNWLTVLPITEFKLGLSKQPFWDSIRLQYGWENMQSTNILSLW